MSNPPKPITLIQLLDRARLSRVDIQGSPETTITGISLHAQKTERNQLFVATVGTKIDSHSLISEAVQRGASAILVQRDIPAYPGVAIIRVPDTRRAVGPFAHAFYGNPANDMKIVGVTGTNGKTSVTRLIASVLRTAGASSGVIGTLGAEWKNRRLQTDTTTPDAVSLAKTLRQMKDDGVEVVAMEVSSHAIAQARIGGLPMHVGVLTNVTQDHLDFHGTFPRYIAAKRRLFTEYVANTPGGIACFNEKDPVGEELCASYEKDFIGYTEYETSQTDVTARNVRINADGTTFGLIIRGRTARVGSKLLGRFNVANMLATASACHALGLDIDQIAHGLSVAPPIPGRFEPIVEGQPFAVIVDYAHTPDALEKLLRSVRQLTAGRIVTVAGCGGERDKTKRYPMGAAVALASDYVVISSDNPRGEDPNTIAQDMLAGVMESGGNRTPPHQVILDRAQAIEFAFNRARAEDTVVIAGKGHEPYQEICGVRYAFDDRLVSRDILRKMAKQWAPRSSAEVALDPKVTF